MAGFRKKLPVLTPAAFTDMFDKISKAALIDALWCASQLGTDETHEQITSLAARNAQIALRERGDRCPPEITTAASVRIDSDPD